MSEDLNNILIKISALYKQYGIKSVTMDDIANEFGISKKTLYQYFRDKNELVRRVVEMEYAEKNRKLYVLSESSENAIEELLKFHSLIVKMVKDQNPAIQYDLKKYYPEIYIDVIKTKRQFLYKSVRENLLRGKKERVYRKDIDTDIISKLILHWIESFHESEILTREDINNPDTYYHIFQYHVHGIINEKGRNVLEGFVNKNKITLDIR